MLLACRELKMSFDAVPVLKGGYFHIEEKEKAAVVGINGAGKSTLLNLISGQLTPDGGSVTLRGGASFGYLTQHQGLDSAAAVYEELASARAAVFAMEQELRQLELKMSRTEGAELDRLMEEYSRLSHRFEDAGGYAVHSEITGVLKGLGYSESDFSKPCRVLSGGEKTRVALGKLLLTRPDLILLDEPTNHLDIASVGWLEGYLKDYPGAVLIVSHDRYFMDRVVTKIIEVENGMVSMYSGNYSVYAAKKAAEREIALKHYYNQQKVIRHEEAVITRLKSYNREKSIRRAESREKMLARIDRLEKPRELNDSMHLKLSSSAVSGQDVLTVDSLSKHFGSRTLFQDLTFTLRRGEKVALIGENGSGKTTILKALTGSLRPDGGSIRFGAQVEVGYYDQEQHTFNENNTLFEEIRESYPKMTDTEIRNLLAAFLFTGDDVFKPIPALSGGERGRLSLAKLMLSPCNLLILDEPTNHLDIVSREILEDALSAFEGTLFFVSHDRYFINRLAGRILELDGGTLTEYLGNYDDYLEKKAACGNPASDAAETAGKGLTDSAQRRREQKEADSKRRRLENALKKTEEQIEELEARIAALEAEMALPGNATDAKKLLELDGQAAAARKELTSLYEKWEGLSEQA
ncbi:MAG: ABC-F family ATP-binding cassette domain-containing protein [Lachnospiraceae bacterium]|nr:ABC-F family ATP-binding cassette domain-containing protein [Lachnospiraceae bacterium]